MNVVPLRRHKVSIARHLGMLVVGPLLFTAILGTLVLTVIWHEVAGLFDLDK